MRDLAVLIGDPLAGVTAALAITRLVRRGEKMDDNTLLAAMQTTAHAITRSLGLSLPP